MAAILAKGFIALFTAFAALIGAAHAGRVDAATLHQAFEAGCQDVQFGMCFLGIQLGQTTIAQARDILARHSWVISVNPYVVYDYFEVAHQHFVWRDPQMPDAPVWRGELIASEDAIESVRLESEVTLGALWGALGSPGIMAHQGQPNHRVPPTLLSYLFFTDNTMVVSRAPACPISYRGFLLGEVNALELRNTAFSLAQGQPAGEMSNLGQLLRDLRLTSADCP